jgi:hypothetical protein
MPPLVEPPIPGAWAMLDDLHDRAELIELWIGLGIAASIFVLALWLLPL